MTSTGCDFHIYPAPIAAIDGLLRYAVQWNEMIGEFADKRLERFWLYDEKQGIPAAIHAVLRRKLNMVAFAETLQDLRVPPSNHLEALKGGWAGYYGIRVNLQWRLVFQWSANTATSLQLVDYH